VQGRAGRPITAFARRDNASYAAKPAGCQRDGRLILRNYTAWVTADCARVYVAGRGLDGSDNGAY